MKAYRLVKDSHRNRTLHTGSTRLPLVITSDSHVPYPGISVAFTMLLHHFEGEAEAEVKARLLARPVALALRRLGDEWTLTEAGLNDLIMLTMVQFKTAVDEAQCDYAVELLSSCRRDTLRLSN
jgi:hypothetical protein